MSSTGSHNTYPHNTIAINDSLDGQGSVAIEAWASGLFANAAIIIATDDFTRLEDEKLRGYIRPVAYKIEVYK